MEAHDSSPESIAGPEDDMVLHTALLRQEIPELKRPIPQADKFEPITTAPLIDARSPTPRVSATVRCFPVKTEEVTDNKPEKFDSPATESALPNSLAWFTDKVSKRDTAPYASAVEPVCTWLKTVSVEPSPRAPPILPLSVTVKQAPSIVA